MDYFDYWKRYWILVSRYYGWSPGPYIDVMMYHIKWYALLVDHVFLNSVFCSFSPLYLNYRHPDFIWTCDYVLVYFLYMLINHIIVCWLIYWKYNFILAILRGIGQFFYWVQTYFFLFSKKIDFRLLSYCCLTRYQFMFVDSLILIN